MTPRTILLLGGTGEARRLAEHLTGVPGLRLISSLAGRVSTPALPPGEVRIGGFGGVDGLITWLRKHQVDALIDATHPFAARISTNAALAVATIHIPSLVLSRPGWTPHSGDTWHRVPSVRAAAEAVPSLGDRVFLTTGRLELSEFAGLPQWFLARSVEPPEPPLPDRIEVLLDRGPFTVEGERELLRRYRIDLLVSKDSGGSMTVAKLAAARELAIPVLLVDRPVVARPSTTRIVSTVEDAVDWVLAGLH